MTMQELGELLLVTAGYLTAAGVLLGIVGWLVKPRVVEWVQTEVIRPIKETNHAVTVNGHADPNNPTIRDEIDTMKRFQTNIGVQVDRIETKVDDAAQKVEAAAEKVDNTAEQLKSHVTLYHPPTEGD